jgi:acyl CoA:acetate/3-ketoacid CoA transferase alpha subunit
MGAPFLPVRGILGSAYLEVNPRLQVIPDPFSGEDLVVVQALCPDVTLVHGGQGDEAGNILLPRVSDWALAIRASRTVIATVEERVAGPLQDQPDWRLIPGIHLTALVHQPQGAWPTAYPGYYGPDAEHLALYLQSAKDREAFSAYLETWVRDSHV